MLERNPVVVARAIRNNNLHCHSPKMAWFAYVAGGHRRRVVGAGAKWRALEPSGVASKLSGRCQRRVVDAGG